MSRRMPCSATEVQVEALLNSLKQALKRNGLWASTPPSAWAMQSEAPFACDRMSFIHWLQFIFIPKMQDLLSQGQDLPKKMELLPMAEQWQVEGTSASLNKRAIVEIVAQIDELFNRKANS